MDGWRFLYLMLCFSVILAWMDRRRQSIMNIGDPSDSGEVVKITDVKEHFLSFFELIDYADKD